MRERDAVVVCEQRGVWCVGSLSLLEVVAQCCYCLAAGDAHCDAGTRLVAVAKEVSASSVLVLGWVAGRRVGAYVLLSAIWIEHTGGLVLMVLSRRPSACEAVSLGLQRPAPGAQEADARHLHRCQQHTVIAIHRFQELCHRSNGCGSDWDVAGGVPARPGCALCS